MYKILLVEDDNVCSSSINKLLTDFCQLHITSSSAIALNLTNANKYSLVMIDVNLHSGSSGIATANSIRNLSGYKSVPIVAFSISKLNESKEYLLSRGYTHLIPELFNIRNFAQHIKFILSSRPNTYDSMLMEEEKILVPKLEY